MFELSDTQTPDAYHFKKYDENKWLQHSNGGGGIRYYTDANQATNSRIKMYYADAMSIPDDPYELNNKTYGLMEHSDDSSYGYALMADDDSTARAELYQLVTLDSEHKENKLYVPKDSDITQWTFENVSEDKYKLKAGSKYLYATSNTLKLTEDPDAAGEFKVIPNDDNTICLKIGDNYVHYDQSSENFDIASTATKLNFAGISDVSSSDSITYTANRISVSDGEHAYNGAELIVYTRLWDDETKKYEYYAIDHNGTLRQVFAYGDKIMWLDDSMNTLLWKFTVHYNSVKTENGYVKTENGYYELRNTHSDKYLAPQLTGNQILSDNKILYHQYPHKASHLRRGSACRRSHCHRLLWYPHSGHRHRFHWW